MANQESWGCLCPNCPQRAGTGGSFVLKHCASQSRWACARQPPALPCHTHRLLLTMWSPSPSCKAVLGVTKAPGCGRTPVRGWPVHAGPCMAHSQAGLCKSCGRPRMHTARALAAAAWAWSRARIHQPCRAAGPGAAAGEEQQREGRAPRPWDGAGAMAQRAPGAAGSLWAGARPLFFLWQEGGAPGLGGDSPQPCSHVLARQETGQDVYRAGNSCGGCRMTRGGRIGGTGPWAACVRAPAVRQGPGSAGRTRRAGGERLGRGPWQGAGQAAVGPGLRAGLGVPGQGLGPGGGGNWPQ